jgi:hypothetical protein
MALSLGLYHSTVELHHIFLDLVKHWLCHLRHQNLMALSLGLYHSTVELHHIFLDLVKHWLCHLVQQQLMDLLQVPYQNFLKPFLLF